MAKVVSTSRDSTHRFSKTPVRKISLIAGMGVANDAHGGTTVKHRSRVAKDPSQPNLRQVHLIHHELLTELEAKGFPISPGDMGENILTQGLDLLALPRGARLRFGSSALVEVTGLRNPCQQLNDFSDGLMQAVLDHDKGGHLIRKAGIMAIVIESGDVAVGDTVRLTEPDKPFLPLEPV